MRTGHVQVLFAALVTTAAASIAADDPKADATTKVTGVFTIAAGDESIEGVSLTIQLWEYDPLLADVGATLIEKIEIKNVKHTKGETSKIEFTIGQKGSIKERRNYYVTARGYLDGKYVYYGKPSHDDIGRVITEGKPRKIEFNGKRMK